MQTIFKPLFRPKNAPKVAQIGQFFSKWRVIEVKTFMGAYMGAFMQEPLLWARTLFWAFLESQEPHRGIFSVLSFSLSLSLSLSFAVKL